MTYLDKLRSPRWQKKRLEILNRDKFTCQNCRSKDKELHIHHLLYRKGKEPWEIEDKYLKTLCSDCHKEEEKIKAEIDEFFADACCDSKKRFINLIKQRNSEQIPSSVILESFSFLLRSQESIVYFFHLNDQLPFINKDGKIEEEEPE